MTVRLMIAYGLMLVMAAQVVGLVWWHRYHSPRRSHARQRTRQRKKELAAAFWPDEASDEK